MTKLGTAIKSLRLAKGLSKEDLGKAAGISASTVGQIERGEIKRPPLKRLEGFSQALGKPVDYFLKLLG